MSKKEALKPNRYYHMIENPSGWDAIEALMKRSKGAATLFIAMLRVMDKQNALMASQKALGEHINTSRQTVNGYIKILSEGGYVQVLKSGKSSIYLINASIAWAGKRSDRLQAEFDCKVLLSLSEQSKAVQQQAWIDRKNNQNKKNKD